MKAIYITLFLQASMLFASCTKENTISKNNSIPRIAWRTLLGPELFDNIPSDPYIFQNKLIMGYALRSGNEGYFIYDKNSGKVLKDISSQASFDAVSVGYKNLYFSKIGVNIRTINLDNYEVKSRKLTNPDWTSPTLTQLDNTVVFPKSGRSSGDLNVHSYQFIKSNLDNINEESIFYKGSFSVDTSVFGTSVKHVVIDINSEGDKIMYHAAVSGYWKVGSKSRYKVVAYNITKDRLEWQTPEFKLPGLDGGYVCDFEPIVIKNILILGLGGTHIYGFDIETGQEKWLTQVDNFGVNMIEYNGKLTFISMQGDMYLIDARSGSIIKKSSVGPANVFNISLHKGVLYFATVLNKLFAVDADTHEILWETKPPNSCSYCNYGFKYTIVDPETDRLYISDGREVICYQLK